MVVSCRGETQRVWNVHNVSSTRIAEFDFLTSVNLKKAGMDSRNIVIKNNTRCFKSALR